MTTVVGLYPSLLDAQKTIGELIDTGFNRSVISIIMRNERVVAATDGSDVGLAVEDGDERSIACASGERRRVLVAGPLARNHEPGALGARWAVADALRDAGLGRFAVNGLVEALCAGAILVAVKCEDRRVNVARDILDSSALTEIPAASTLDRHRGSEERLLNA